MIIQGTAIIGTTVSSSAATVTADSYFNLVSLLLPGNGTNGQTNNTFLDSSTNNFAITRNGNTTQGTFSPFSQTGWSNYFDGTDSLTIPTGAFSYTSGTAFTFECWVYRSSTTGSSSLAQIVVGTVLGGQALSVYVTNTGQAIYGQANVTDIIASSTGVISLNQWYHIAISKNASNTVRMWVNGTSVGTATDSTNYAVSSMYIGRNQANTQNLDGYVSNLRSVVGSSVYDPTQTTITVPTAPLTAITNTSLLTCQSNRFIDNSSNAFAITVNGNVSVQPFSPFQPDAAYSTTTVGGSGYFDGTGDYLTVADSATLEPGSSNFTIECWIYPTATGSFLGVFSKRTNNSTDYSPIQILINSGTMILSASTTGSSWAVNVNASTSPPLNAWSHIAVVRNGTASNNLVLYLNGVSVATGSVSNTALVNNSGAWAIAADSDDGGGNFAGYISGFRYVLGSAVYTSAFTPPAAPVTAVTNTSLLLNYTNGGITDAAAKNVLETAGGAAISTTQSKFGGSSMAFDSGLGSYLLLPSPQTQNFVFGSGDFTIEFFIFFTATAQFMHIYDQRPAATDGAYPTIRLSTGGNQLEYVSGGSVSIVGGSITTNVWYHVALSRSGTSTKLFLNGTQIGSTFTDTTSYLNGTNRPFIGRSGFHTVDPFYLSGYINDLRITKGYARYTANFTPPTTAFPTQ